MSSCPSDLRELFIAAFDEELGAGASKGKLKLVAGVSTSAALDPQQKSLNLWPLRHAL